MTETPAEQTVFEEGGIRITNLRAILGPKTFAMSNITSVDLARQDPANCLPVGMIIGGGLIALFSILAAFSSGGDIAWGWLAAGLVSLGLGFLLVRAAKPTFVVQIGSAGGETRALSSADETYIRRIVDAMNEAIVRRG